jgi:hypothetical protein
MIKNKKGFTASSYLVAAIIFSAGIALFVVMVGSLSSDYGNTDIINPEFSDTFDRFDDETDTIGEMWKTIDPEEKKGLSLVTGVFEIFFKGTFTVISLVVSSVAAAGSQIFGFLEYFGIPTEISTIIGTLVFALLTVTIVFVVINAINAKKDL